MPSPACRKSPFTNTKAKDLWTLPTGLQQARSHQLRIRASVALSGLSHTTVDWKARGRFSTGQLASLSVQQLVDRSEQNWLQWRSFCTMPFSFPRPLTSLLSAYTFTPLVMALATLHNGHSPGWCDRLHRCQLKRRIPAEFNKIGNAGLARRCLYKHRRSRSSILPPCVGIGAAHPDLRGRPAMSNSLVPRLSGGELYDRVHEVDQTSEDDARYLSVLSAAGWPPQCSSCSAHSLSRPSTRVL